MKKVVLTALMAGCLTVCFYQNPSFAGEGKSSSTIINPCEGVVEYLNNMRECPVGADCVSVRARLTVEEEKGGRYCHLYGRVSGVPKNIESGKFEGAREDGVVDVLSDMLLWSTPLNKSANISYQIMDIHQFVAYDHFSLSYPSMKSRIRKRIYFSEINSPQQTILNQDLRKRIDKIAVANIGLEGCRRVHFNCSCTREGLGGTFGYGTGGDDLGQCISIDWLSRYYINSPREACAERWNPADPDALIYQEDVKCGVCWDCLEYCTANIKSN